MCVVYCIWEGFTYLTANMGYQEYDNWDRTLIKLRLMPKISEVMQEFLEKVGNGLVHEVNFKGETPHLIDPISDNLAWIRFPLILKNGTLAEKSYIAQEDDSGEITIFELPIFQVQNT